MVVATQDLGYDREHQRSSPATQSASTGQSQLSETDLGVGVLFNRLLDAVVIARLTTGRIVLWNLAAEKLFGYTPDEAIGKSVEMLMPEPIAHIHRTGIERYVRTGHGLIVDADAPVEMPARTKDGEEFRIELSLSELQNAQGERFAVAVIRDATHRKQLELTNLELVQTRLARAEAESTLAERDELLESVSLALDADPSPAELQRVRRILADFRRLCSGEVTFRSVDGDLVDIVHASCDAARRHAAGRRLLVHTPPAAPASFDPARLRQALDQVLDEVLRQVPAGSRTEVGIEVLSPKLVQLTVRSEIYAEPHPLGLGLQLSRALLEHQGGTLRLDNSTSGSLVVVMTLPGTPHPSRRRPSRPRRLGRAAPNS